MPSFSGAVCNIEHERRQRPLQPRQHAPSAPRTARPTASPPSRSPSASAPRRSRSAAAACWSIASLGGVPTLRISLLPFSSAPSGTSSAGRLGMTESASCNSLSRAFCSSSPLRQLVLQRRHLGHQLGRRRLVLRTLRLADLLGRRVAPRLRLLQPRDHLAPPLVQRDQLRRELHVPAGQQPAPLQASVERPRIVANPLDVEHRRAPLAPPSSPRRRGPSSPAHVGSLSS